MSNPDHIKKYEELYDLTKNGLADELEGIRQLEEKASRYLAVMGVLLGVSSLGIKLVIETILPTKTFYDGILTITLIFFLVFAFWTILILFTVFKTRALSHFPINNDLLDFFSQNNYLNAIFALTRGNIQAVATNRSVRLDKIRRLSYGYILMMLSISFLAIFTSAIIARPFINSSASIIGSPTMSDERQNKPNESKPSEDKPAGTNEPKPDASVKPPAFDTIQRSKPDPNVKPPNYVLFKEGYDPKAGKDKSSPPDSSKKDD